MFGALKSRASMAAVGAACLGAALYRYNMPGQAPGGLVPSASAEAHPSALNPGEWRAFKLAKKETLTPNTFLFRFELPAGTSAALPVASCLVTKALLAAAPGEPPKPVIRPYTPTSAPNAVGYMDLIVKVYPAGLMSAHIGSLKVGDSLDFKGPIPKYEYKPNAKKSIGMVAGGTGITPMMQVIDAIVANPADKTEVRLVFANVSEQDIILRSKLDALASRHSQIKVHYVVDKSSNKKWKGSVGYVTPEILKQHLPKPNDDHAVFVCGPPGMMGVVSGNKAKDKSQGELTGLLKDLGYDASQVYKF